MEIITARSNEKIKYASKLASSASFRKECGEFLIEGARLCSDAAQSGARITKVFYTEAAAEKYRSYLDIINPADGICCEISPDVAKKLSDTENPQGIFCICRAKSEETPLDENGKYLALEDVQDPSNLGAISRSAEALGLSGLIVSGGCDIYNPKALRASMGSLFRLTVIKTDSLENLISEAGAKGMKTLASVPSRDAVDIRKTDKSGGVICCIGNEGNGLKPETVKACAERITIPMAGRAESFNASAAAAILAWELVR